MALASGLDVRPLMAHCDGAVGRLYRRTGAREQAEAHLTAAGTIYGEMATRASLEQLERS